MFRSSSRPLSRRLYAVLVMLALGATSLRAEDAFVVSKYGTASAQNESCPPSCTTGSVSSSGSTSVSTASPVPIIPAATRRVRFGFANGCTWSVQPTTHTTPNGFTFNQLQNVNGYYKVYITKGTSTSSSTDILVNMTVDGTTTLYDLNTNVQTSLSLNA